MHGQQVPGPQPSTTTTPSIKRQLNSTARAGHESTLGGCRRSWAVQCGNTHAPMRSGAAPGRCKPLQKNSLDKWDTGALQQTPTAPLPAACATPCSQHPQLAQMPATPRGPMRTSRQTDTWHLFTHSPSTTKSSPPLPRRPRNHASRQHRHTLSGELAPHGTTGPHHLTSSRAPSLDIVWITQ
jgi:hypothetical protein